jgi:hypothetical protein
LDVTTTDLQSSEHQVDPRQDDSKDPQDVFLMTNLDLMDPRDPEVFVMDLLHFIMAGRDSLVALHLGMALNHLGSPRMSQGHLVALNLECVEEEEETFGTVVAENGVDLEDLLVEVAPLVEEDLETEVFTIPRYVLNLKLKDHHYTHSLCL